MKYPEAWLTSKGIKYTVLQEVKASTSTFKCKPSPNFGNPKNCSSRADINLYFKYFGHSLKIVVPIVMKYWTEIKHDSDYRVTCDIYQNCHQRWNKLQRAELWSNEAYEIF